MKVYKNKIFLKIDKTRFTWKYIYTLDEMKNKYVIIFTHLRELYPQQLSNFDITGLFLSDLDLVFSKIKKNNGLLNEINFFDKLIEFKDGIFFYDERKFITFNDIDIYKEIKTLLHFDCMYSELSFCLDMFCQKIDEKIFMLVVDEFKLK